MTLDFCSVEKKPNKGSNSIKLKQETLLNLPDS